MVGGVSISVGRRGRGEEGRWGGGEEERTRGGKEGRRRGEECVRGVVVLLRFSSGGFVYSKVDVGEGDISCSNCLISSSR